MDENKTFRYQWTKQIYCCPECGYSNKYSRYIDLLTGELLPNEYGKCARVNSCKYSLIPEHNELINIDEICEDIEDLEYSITTEKSLYNIDLQVSKSLEYELDKFRHFYEYTDSSEGLIQPNFIIKLIKKFGLNEVMKANENYNIAPFFCQNQDWGGSSVIYPYYFKGSLITGKIIRYNKDLHRNKYYMPQWLHNIENQFGKGEDD